MFCYIHHASMHCAAQYSSDTKSEDFQLQHETHETCQIVHQRLVIYQNFERKTRHTQSQLRLMLAAVGIK